MRVRQDESGKMLVLDVLRRRYVKLTPEEMVRQCFVNYLIEYKGYPAGLMGNEVQLMIGEKKLRCDSVLYGLDLQPRMIIEYKAPNIEITQKVLHQILSYNTQLNVKYLIMSNGTQHVCLHYNEDLRRWEYMMDIPDYATL